MSLREQIEAVVEENFPTIRIGVDLHRVVDEACAALGHAEDIFQRDGELVRVTRAAEPDARRGVILGTPQIHSVGLPTIREVLSRVARWERHRKNRDGSFTAESCTPTEAVCAAVLARREYLTVRPLAGVVETPCLRPDGSLLSTPGYDAATGLLYEPTCEVGFVPERPTQREAAAALERLRDCWVDFPFSSDAASCVPLAAVLTLIGRPAIEGSVPMIANDATTAGSGKSLLADSVAVLATGRSAPRMTYPPDEAELEKTLVSCALFGARLVLLDNIAGVLGAAPLDKVLTTEDRVALRILGRSEIRELPWRAVLMASGNNLVLGADTARRSLICRLEPDVERPEERTGFQHENLLAFMRANRGALVADALTILRGFVVAGKPRSNGSTWGSFESWARLVPAAIVWAGGPDILACRAVTMGAPDPEAEALRTLLCTLPSFLATHGTNGNILARDMIDALWPARRLGEPAAPDGWDGLRDAIDALCPPRRPGEPPNVVRFGRALRKVVGRVVGGTRLTVRLDRTKRQLWGVELMQGVQGVAGDAITLRAESVRISKGSNGSQQPLHPLHPLRTGAGDA